MTTAKHSDSLSALWFGKGADARLAGTPPSACPRWAGEREVEHWLMGWADADAHWGRFVRGRWAFRPLPKVREVAAG